MSARRTGTAAALAALATSCTLARAPAPVLLSVEPSKVPEDASQELVVHGRNFSAAVRADLDAPASSAVNAAFALALVARGARVPLGAVALVSDVELRATLAARSAPPGVYDLELVDPRGQVARLARALTVYARVCAADGVPCEDGNACTDPDACSGGRCSAGAWTCRAVDTAPIACFDATPTASPVGIVFTFDAGCSSDLEDPFSALAIRFDFDGSGTWYAADGGKSKRAYPDGVYVATVAVTDTGGLTAYASRLLVAINPSADLDVDTDLDVVDPADGKLSVREAFEAVSDPAAAGRTIRFAGPYRIALSSALPEVRSPGTSVVGQPGVVLDFSGAAAPACVTLAGPDQRLVGLEIAGCAGAAAVLSGTGAQVSGCTIASERAGVGILAQPSGGGTIGPGNDVSGAATGVEVGAGAWVVDGNRIHANGTGVRVDGAALVRRNVVFANGADGLRVAGGAGATVSFNVFDGNGRAQPASGVSVATAATGVVLKDDLFTANAMYGVAGEAKSFAPGALDHDGFFGNGDGPAAPGLALVAPVLADPWYVDLSRGDYRLLPGSPAVDAGVDVGLDVNGPSPGNFDGAAPDLGATESPYAAP